MPAISLITSDSLHNKNCYEFLQHMELPVAIFSLLPDALQKNMSLVAKDSPYDAGQAYADIYTQFFQYVEENIETLYDAPRLVWATYLNRLSKHNVVDRKEIQEEIDALDSFIVSLYDNDNKNLEVTFQAIKSLTLAQTPSSAELEKAISSLVKDKGELINKETASPAGAGSVSGRFNALVSEDFKPQHTTSLSTLRQYNYNREEYRKELRFGTQGQRHKGKARVSPLFERFLRIQAERELDKSKITHIYFNNLGLDRKDVEGTKEKELTESLHKLEEKNPNVAIITLPADKGLLHSNSYKSTKAKFAAHTVFEELLEIASQDPEAMRTVKDFKISDSIRKRLFSDSGGHYTLEREKDILRHLLIDSFEALGINPDNKISVATRQAVWFHFIKFQLTHYIIEKLNPNYYNFSCKDAIDRGGVSSAYYNLLASFESFHPMDRAEFECALHAAPTMVKGRGMNHHLKVIWNAVDAYAIHNHKDLKDAPNKTWLIEWRDYNCPHARVAELLQLRGRQCLQELTEILPNSRNRKVRDCGLQILAEINKQSELDVSGKRLLLEVAVMTPALILNPTTKNLARYDVLYKKLDLNPFLLVIGGFMKLLFGLVVAAFTLGFCTGFFKSGLSTMKAGYTASTRQELRTEMKQLLSDLTRAHVGEETEEQSDCWFDGSGFI